MTWVRLDHEGKDPTRGRRRQLRKGDDVDLVWRLVPVEEAEVLDHDRVVTTTTLAACDLEAGRSEALDREVDALRVRLLAVRASAVAVGP